MPYPAQIQLDTLIARATELIERDGVEDLTLAKLAAEFGVSAPSIYKHLANKAALLQAVNLYTTQGLAQAMAVAKLSDTNTTLLEIAHAYRAFAHAHPQTYSLAFTTTQAASRPDPKILEGIALPLQVLMSELVGVEQALTALRGLWALIHGYVLLELHTQIQRGGDLDTTFTAIVQTYLRGLAQDSTLR